MTTNAERLQRWNTWYERTPEPWRFQLIVWALVVVGALNMLLTIAVGFPFALLVGLAIAAIAAVRVPYVLGWIKADGEPSAAGTGGGTRLEIEPPSWVLQVNRWYDGLDELQRGLVVVAALVIPGAINMLLTFAGVVPFGLLFLLALLALIAIRAPYAAGWFKGSPAASAGPALAMARPAPRIGDESAGAAPRRPAEPVPIVQSDPSPAASRSAAGAQAPEPRQG